ncbi:hypothetical protein FRC10_009324 [Ceratobasidium sp. 414]|nr:hypothetical protein FRC10_009324 [Ceratobasidium sp. 414]
METVVVFAQVLSKDFIGQYYGAGQDLANITVANPSDYRRIVMAVLEVLSTDSLAIIGGQQLSNRVLSLSVVLTTDPNTGGLVPNGENSTTYVNGDQGPWPAEANLYFDTIWNLVNAVNDAVNLDLGSNRYENLYRNTTVMQHVIRPNLPPAGIPSSNWSAVPDGRSFYYGSVTPPYRTWAEMLLAGQPVAVGALTGLPDESAMVTTYLCPAYRVKPIGPLLSSVFVGSATMITAAWQAEEEEARRQAGATDPAKARFTKPRRRASGCGDEVKVNSDPVKSSGVDSLELRRLSYTSGSTLEDK